MMNKIPVAICYTFASCFMYSVDMLAVLFCIRWGRANQTKHKMSVSDSSKASKQYFTPKQRQVGFLPFSTTTDIFHNGLIRTFPRWPPEMVCKVCVLS